MVFGRREETGEPGGNPCERRGRAQKVHAAQDRIRDSGGVMRLHAVQTYKTEILNEYAEYEMPAFYRSEETTY